MPCRPHRRQARCPTAGQEVEQFGAGLEPDAGLDRHEGERSDDRPDGIDRGPFPGEDAPHPMIRPGDAQQRRHHGRTRHDEDGAEHDRGLPRQPEEPPCEQAGPGPGDRYPEGEQPAGDTPAVTLQFGEGEIETTVEEDDRHGQSDERHKGRPEGHDRIDRAREAAGQMPDRQQQDDGRELELPGDDLASHGQGEREPDPDENLGRRHGPPPPTVRLNTDLLPRVGHHSERVKTKDARPIIRRR